MNNNWPCQIVEHIGVLMVQLALGTIISSHMAGSLVGHNTVTVHG